MEIFLEINRTRVRPEWLMPLLDRVLMYPEAIFGKVKVGRLRLRIGQGRYTGTACPSLGIVQINLPDEPLDVLKIAWLFSHELLHIMGVEHKDYGEAMLNSDHPANKDIWAWTKNESTENAVRVKRKWKGLDHIRGH